MHRIGLLALLPILLASLIGCATTEQVESSSWLKRFHNQAISPDHAILKVAIIERPLDDEFINRGLWRHADSLVVLDSERRTALEQNGFRIGQLIGPPSADYHELLLSKHYCRNPHVMIFPSGQAKQIHLSSVLPEAAFEIVQDRQSKEVVLDQARFCLEVTAKFGAGGRTRLMFTPRIETNDAVLPFRASPDKSAWEYRIEKAAKTYPELSWEVSLEPNQDLIVGARPERKRSLGAASFIQQEGGAMVQRLLVVRNCRSATAQEVYDSSAEELVRADKSMPLAVQAGTTTYRAKP